MTAWLSLVLLFLLPAVDLALRLLGLPPWLVIVGDVLALAVPAFSLWRTQAWGKSPWHSAVPAVALGLLLAAAWYGVRVSAFTFSPFAENIYDLHYIASLVRASELPAQELWNPGAELDRYYYFGFYIVAFYTRLLGLQIGQGYALFLLLVPIVVFANYWAVMRGGMLWRGLAAFTATFPSTGLSFAVLSGAFDIGEHARGMAHVRLTEWSNLALPDGYTAALANGYAYPIEGLAHLLGWLGDLHPPVFTLLLLSIAVASLVSTAGRVGALVCGAAVPLSFALNPWTLPCFALLGAYAAFRRARLDEIAAAAIGALVAALLLLPLFLHLDLATSSVSLRWLPAAQRSTPVQFLTIWGPLLLATLLLAWKQGWPVLALLFAALVVGLEVVLIDDPYGDRYERFNGVLKIGSFALAGWTAAVLVAAGHDERRWLRFAILLPLLAVSLIQLADALAPSLRRPLDERNWALAPERMLAREDHRLLFDALRGQCPGITLERRIATAYTDSPLVSTLLGWPTLSGWPAHLTQIRAMTDADHRWSDAMQEWFKAPEPTIPRIRKVRYVLVDETLGWSEGELARHAAALAPDYRFERLRPPGDRAVVGYFVAATGCRETDNDSGS